MITTPAPVLSELSGMLNESTTDTSSKRLGYFNRSVRKVLSVKKWGFEKRTRTLTLVAEIQTYDLTAQFIDYNPIKGIISVWVNGAKIDSIDYDEKADVATPASQKFYLDPDNQTIGFRKTIAGDEEIKVIYYANHTYVTAQGETLTFDIPDDMILPIALYMKHLVHEGKRQRYDSRNALIDFKEEIDSLRPMAGSKKIKDRPRTVGNIFRYNRVKRSYGTH